MSVSKSDVSDWWTTEIIDMAPGQIRLRGNPIEDLIGNISFPQMIWLMTRGELPNKEQANLLECALVGAVDHGPQAPSIASPLVILRVVIILFLINKFLNCLITCSLDRT